MKPIQHYGTFAAGKLRANTFTAALRALAERDVPVVLTVAEFKPTRSGQANRFYWGVVIELIHRALNDSGVEVSREGTHELLKYRFLRQDKPIGDNGEFITLVRSTTELDKEEFGEYLEKCIQFAAEYLSVVIPEAGSQMELAA